MGRDEDKDKAKDKELCYREIENLKKFRSTIDSCVVCEEGKEGFAEEYENLIAQITLISKVSDRFQKKIRESNLKIAKQNEEIQSTVDQLKHAKIGKKASLIMLFLTFILFMMEEKVIEPLINENVDIAYVNLGILIVLFAVVKILESTLHTYLMNKEKKRILDLKEGRSRK